MKNFQDTLIAIIIFSLFTPHSWTPLSLSHSSLLLFTHALKPLVSSCIFNYHLAFKLVYHLLTNIGTKISPLGQHIASARRRKEEVNFCLVILREFWSWRKQGLKCFWDWKWGRLLELFICGYVTIRVRVFNMLFLMYLRLEMVFSNFISMD